MFGVRRACVTVLLLTLTAVLPLGCSPDPPASDAPVPAERPREADPKTALLADFANDTGDAIFDFSLKHALATALGQSPYVRVTSGERVAEALRALNRSADERVTADLAWEIASREGIGLVILGAIRHEKGGFAITLDAVDAASGATVASARAGAAEPAATLVALSEAALDLRRGLGEPAATLAAFNRPVAELATSSLEALSHYAAGREHSNRGRQRMAVPHYCRAIAADPAFRLAHVALDGVDQDTRAAVGDC